MKKKLLTSTALSALFAAWMASGQTAFAADLVVIQPEYVPAPELVDIFDWTGPYIGIHGGYSWGKGRSDPEYSENGPVNLSGLLIGIHAGLNRQFSNGFVLGLEGDVSYTDYSGSNHLVLAPQVFDLRFRSEWQGSARVRAGYAMDNTLLYATAGLAVAGGKLSIGDFSDRKTHIGWTAGVGIEHAFTPNWLGRIEVRYSDFSKQTYNTPIGDIKHGFNQTTATVGISYKF